MVAIEHMFYTIYSRYNILCTGMKHIPYIVVQDVVVLIPFKVKLTSHPHHILYAKKKSKISLTNIQNLLVYLYKLNTVNAKVLPDNFKR